MVHVLKLVLFSVLGTLMLVITTFVSTPNVSSSTSPLPTPTPSMYKWSIVPLALEEEILHVDEQQTRNFDVSSADKTILLSFEAHVDWHKLGGDARIFGININEKPVTGEFLINKPLNFTYADGRSSSYYALIDNSISEGPWSLFYSPDYISNNLPGSNYQVVEGQAYLFIFDITELVLRNEVNTIELINFGANLQEQLGRTVSLSVRQVRLLKKSNIKQQYLPFVWSRPASE